jgi:hypothetical protein
MNLPTYRRRRRHLAQHNRFEEKAREKVFSKANFEILVDLRLLRPFSN